MAVVSRRWSVGGSVCTLRRVRIEVNGEAREVDEGLTVGGLLSALSLAGQLVAVERNEEIVPRAEHGRAVLAEGDRIEIVQFVGGG